VDSQPEEGGKGGGTIKLRSMYGQPGDSNNGMASLVCNQHPSISGLAAPHPHHGYAELGLRGSPVTEAGLHHQAVIHLSHMTSAKQTSYKSS